MKVRDDESRASKEVRVMIRQTWCWLTTRHHTEPGRYCGCHLVLSYPGARPDDNAVA